MLIPKRRLFKGFAACDVALCARDLRIWTEFANLVRRSPIGFTASARLTLYSPPVSAIGACSDERPPGASAPDQHRPVALLAEQSKDEPFHHAVSGLSHTSPPDSDIHVEISY